ncbi:hypothetical protein WN943_018182 [Citrus x changshan-huyou]
MEDDDSLPPVLERLPKHFGAAPQEDDDEEDWHYDRQKQKIKAGIRTIVNKPYSESKKTDGDDEFGTHEPKLDNFFNEAMASDARSAPLILPNRHPMFRVKRRRIIVLKPSCTMLPWYCQNRIKHGLQERSYDQTAVFKEKFRALVRTYLLIVLAKAFVVQRSRVN